MGLKVRSGPGSEQTLESSEAERRERQARRAEVRRGEEEPRAGLIGEAGRVVFEVLVLLAQVWIALAEIAGRFVLGLWLRAAWIALAGGRIAAAGMRIMQRWLRPAHGTLAVAIAALAVLVVSQYVDYRGISVGTREYAGDIEFVPPPDVGRERTGEAHSWLMVPLAVFGLVAVALAVLGRPRMARLLVPAGVAVLAIAILVDMPQGLDEGSATVAYEGARARLLEGFWAQTVAGAVMVFAGILLPIQLRALGRRTDARGGPSATRPRRARTRARPRAISA
jgi:hypothetical protein